MVKRRFADFEEEKLICKVVQEMQISEGSQKQTKNEEVSWIRKTLNISKFALVDWSINGWEEQFSHTIIISTKVMACFHRKSQRLSCFCK